MNDKLKVNMNEYLPLRDVVFNILRQAIITGEFAPGERLMEIALAERLGVSRTPVREAIRKLELEGLVVMIPRKGAEVAKITEKDLKDILDVRCALEELSASLAAEKINEEQKKELKFALLAFEKAIQLGDTAEIADKDMDFHDVIFEIADNPRLTTIVNNLRELIYRYRLEYVKDFDYHDTLITEHRKLTEAILNHEGEKAQRIMKKHIYNQEITVIKNIQSYKSGRHLHMRTNACFSIFTI